MLLPGGAILIGVIAVVVVKRRRAVEVRRGLVSHLVLRVIAVSLSWSCAYQLLPGCMRHTLRDSTTSDWHTTHPALALQVEPAAAGGRAVAEGAATMQVRDRASLTE